MKLNKSIRYNLVVLAETISLLLLSLPRFTFFNYIKSKYLQLFFGAKIGRRVIFYPGVWIFTGRSLTVGDDVDFAKDVLITTDGGVTIGDRVLIGYRTQILSANHNIPPSPHRIFEAGHTKAPVNISDDVWIGANCIILPGVEIGEGSVIAAGSVVTKHVPAFSYAAGIPARVIKERI